MYLYLEFTSAPLLIIKLMNKSLPLCEVVIPVTIPEYPLTVVISVIVSSNGVVSIGTSTFGGVT